jgi:hypothetical protein
MVGMMPIFHWFTTLECAAVRVARFVCKRRPPAGVSSYLLGS